MRVRALEQNEKDIISIAKTQNPYLFCKTKQNTVFDSEEDNQLILFGEAVVVVKGTNHSVLRAQVYQLVQFFVILIDRQPL